MTRGYLLCAALAVAAPAFAQSPADAPTWNQPATVWREANAPPPRVQPLPVVGVPAPEVVANPKPVPPPAVPSVAPGAVPLSQLMPTAVIPPAAAPPAVAAVPQMVVPQSSPGLATMPLEGIVGTPLPMAPTVPPFAYTSGADCAPAAANCAPAVGRPAGNCLVRLRDWLCFQPGPAVLPKCQPARYEAPVRSYFPCVNGANCGAAGNCGPAPQATGHAPLPGNGFATRLGERFTGLMTPGGGVHGPVGLGTGVVTATAPVAGEVVTGSGGGVLGPIAGGCGQTGLLDGTPLGHLGHLAGTCRDGDGCVHIKHKGLGACSEPSAMAPVTGPICVTTQAVGVPLPASCVGSPPDYTGCYAGCGVAAAACRRGAGGHLMDRLFGTCHGGCSEVAQGGNGFAPTSVVPVVTGYVRPRTGNFRFAHPTDRGTVTSPAIGQPNVDGVGPQLIQSGHRDATRPFTRQ